MPSDLRRTAAWCRQQAGVVHRTYGTAHPDGRELVLLLDHAARRCEEAAPRPGPGPAQGPRLGTNPDHHHTLRIPTPGATLRVDGRFAYRTDHRGGHHEAPQVWCRSCLGPGGGHGAGGGRSGVGGPRCAVGHRRPRGVLLVGRGSLGWPGGWVSGRESRAALGGAGPGRCRWAWGVSGGGLAEVEGARRLRSAASRRTTRS